MIVSSGRTSQTKLLAGAVVKKRPAETQNVSPKRQKTESKTENCSPDEKKKESENESSKRQRTESDSGMFRLHFLLNQLRI